MGSVCLKKLENQSNQETTPPPIKQITILWNIKNPRERGFPSSLLLKSNFHYFKNYMLILIFLCKAHREVKDPFLDWIHN